MSPAAGYSNVEGAMSDIMIRQLELGPLRANAYLVYRQGRDDCFIIDPGDDLETIEREIAASGRRLTDILLTHGHFDHILAAAPLKEKHRARIHVHPYDAHMLMVAGASLYNGPWCTLPFVPVEADEPYPDTEGYFLLSVCGVSLAGFRTPGHTPGSVCLLVQEQNVIFTGDTLFANSYGRTDFPGGSDFEMRDSLNRLLHMDRGLTVYSGHGEADSMDAIARRWRIQED